MKHALWLCVATLLAACESQPVWQKAGASEATVKDDTQNCHTKARLTPSSRPQPPPSPYASAVVLSAEDTRLRFEQEEFRQCMEEKGYSAKR